MKNKTIIFIITAIILAVSIAALSAQTLSVDSRKVPIQMADNFNTMSVSCSADTLYKRVSVPSNAVEAWVISETGGVDVCPDSLYTKLSGLLRYARIPAATAFMLPVKTHTKFYVRRAAAGTATTVYIIWKKL